MYLGIKIQTEEDAVKALIQLHHLGPEVTNFVDIARCSIIQSNSLIVFYLSIILLLLQVNLTLLTYCFADCGVNFGRAYFRD